MGCDLSDNFTSRTSALNSSHVGLPPPEARVREEAPDDMRNRSVTGVSRDLGGSGDGAPFGMAALAVDIGFGLRERRHRVASADVLGDGGSVDTVNGADPRITEALNFARLPPD